MAVTPHASPEARDRRGPRRPRRARGAAQRLPEPRLVRGRRRRVQLREPGVDGLHRPRPASSSAARGGSIPSTPTTARCWGASGPRPSACAGASRPSSACGAPTASTGGSTIPPSRSRPKRAGSPATSAPATTSASGATPSSRRARGRRRSGCWPTTSRSSIAHFSPDLRCLFANKAYASTWGWDVEAILGRTVEEIIGPEGFREIEPHIRRVLRGETVTYERAIPAADGGTRVLEVNLLPQLGEDGAVMAAFVLISRHLAPPPLRAGGAGKRGAAAQVLRRDARGHRLPRERRPHRLQRRGAAPHRLPLRGARRPARARLRGARLARHRAEQHPHGLRAPLRGRHRAQGRQPHRRGDDGQGDALQGQELPDDGDPRHPRPQGGRGPHPVPGPPRHPHGAAQPRPPDGPPRVHPRLRPAARVEGRHPVHRPRQLQDGERLPRPRRGRCAAAPGRLPHRGDDPLGRRGLAPGRRRIPRGPAGPRDRAVARSRGGEAPRGRERAGRPRGKEPVGEPVHRHRRLPARRRGRRGPHPQRRRRDVPRQGPRPQQLPVLQRAPLAGRLRHALARDAPSRGDPRGGLRAPLPAAGARGHGTPGRPRGAHPLAAGRRRAGHAQRLHPDRRAARPHHAHRRAGCSGRPAGRTACGSFPGCRACPSR